MGLFPILLHLWCFSKCTNRPRLLAMHSSNSRKKWACVLPGSGLMMVVCGVAVQNVDCLQEDCVSAANGCSRPPNKGV